MQGSRRKREQVQYEDRCQAFYAFTVSEESNAFTAVTVKVLQLFSHYYYKPYARCVVSSIQAELLKSVTS